MDGIVFVSVLYLCLLVRLGGWVEVTKLVKIYVSLQSFPQFSGEEFVRGFVSGSFGEVRGEIPFYVLKDSSTLWNNLAYQWFFIQKFVFVQAPS